MPVSDPDVSRPRLIRDATFLEADRREIVLRRGPHNQLGFAYQVAFVRVLGRFPQQAPLEIDGEILRFAALQLGADAETIHAYAGRQQTVSEHQQRIGEYLRLRAFDAAAGERLARFLEDEALRLERTASLLVRARAWLRDEHVLAPADSVLRRAIGAARHKARTLLTQRMAERLLALTLILACIVYWQAREISRMAAAPDFPFDPDLLRHVSPIEWKNVILYGEIKIDPAKLKMRGPYRQRVPVKQQLVDGVVGQVVGIVAIGKIGRHHTRLGEFSRGDSARRRAMTASASRCTL